MSLWDVYNQHLKSATFTDLTHEFFPGQPKFPALPDQTVSNFLRLEDGMLFEIHQWSFVGQWGTHVDPPLHMHQGGRTVADLEVNEMLLPLVVLNCAPQSAENPDYCVRLEDVQTWESAHGRIPAGSFVAMRTDWSKRWPSTERMANRDAAGVQHFPGWSKDVLEFLFTERNITAVGHETTDTDGGIATSRDDSNWSLESYILGLDRWQIELLTNLDQVPEHGALVMATWPKPRGASGFPARVVAISSHGSRDTRHE
jgi:kynurenine formamidase